MIRAKFGEEVTGDPNQSEGDTQTTGISLSLG